MFTFMARFAIVHFLHEAVQVHDPGPKVIFIPFSASCVLLRYVCWLLFLITNLQIQMLRSFHLKVLQNKM